MKYNNIEKGVFLNRPNRFIAEVLIGEEKHTVHVKNTGRCKELLLSGANVWLEKSQNPLRKTQYDLVCVEKNKDKSSVIINMDSQIVNDVAEEWLKKGELFSKAALIRREVKYKNSRFDFYIEEGKRKIFLDFFSNSFVLRVMERYTISNSRPCILSTVSTVIDFTLS